MQNIYIVLHWNHFLHVFWFLQIVEFEYQNSVYLNYIYIYHRLTSNPHIWRYLFSNLFSNSTWSCRHLGGGSLRHGVVVHPFLAVSLWQWIAGGPLWHSGINTKPLLCYLAPHDDGG